MRSIRPRQRLLAAAVCRGGHLHVLTSNDLRVAYGSAAHVEAPKDQIGGAVMMADEGRTGGDVRIAILAFSGLEPGHPFPAAEGLTLARAINTLAGQPPEGPVVTPLGPGRIKRRPSSWRSPTLVQAVDSCDVTVVPDGVQLYFSSGDSRCPPCSPRTSCSGILDEDTSVLIFESRGEPLEIEVDARADDVLAAIPGAGKLDERLDLPGDRRPPPSAQAAAGPANDVDHGAPRRLDGVNATGRRDDGARPLAAPIVTRDGTVIELVLVAAAQADSKWAELVRSSGTSGRWPVIVATRSSYGYDELSRFADEASSDRAAAAPDLLAASVALDPDDVLRRRWEASVPIDGEDAEAFDVYDESLPVGPVRPIPARPAPQGTTTIALIPAAASEEVPAVLGWGNWNGCPRPDEHVAVLRRWRTRLGAELKAMSNDSLELVVSRPPGTFEEALVLAREQYAYAPDIVDQGEHETIGTLAAALVDGGHWHFWWD